MNECSLDYSSASQGALNSRVPVNEGLQRMVKTAFMAYFKVNPRICLKKQRKPMRNFTQKSQSPGQHLNSEPPKY
jgi:hypothetical protein